MSHEIQLLPELLVLAAISLGMVMLFRRLRLPATVGLIVTGVVIGPGGLGLVSDPELVRTLAEFGVVLLLFTVGLEFSPRELAHVGRRGLVAGTLQVGLTLGVVSGGLAIAGLHPAQALFFGALLALSSTALVLKVLSERGELSSPHGRLVTGVLLFQDLMVIPLAIAVPWLARWYGGTASESGGQPLEVALRSLVLLAIVALAFVAARRAAPWLLVHAARTRSREAFLFGVALVALGSAWLTSWAGLSLALGAFLAGLILSESEVKARVAADVLPLTDGLASVFFISIGMLLTPRLVIDQPLLVIASTFGLVGIKLVAAVAAFRFSPAPWRVALAGGMSLAQVGEFSFVLAAAGMPSGLLGELGGQAFFAGSVLSLMLTPLLVAYAPEWALALQRRRGGGEAGSLAPAAESGEKPLSDHVVIAGFGLNGQNLARVLRAVRLPHIVVDLNADALRAAAAEGSRGLIGDIANPLIQQRAGLPRARTLVLALSDPSATRHACQLARTTARDLHIIVRTRYVSEIDELHRLGASQVIPEEFETSIEIFTATLRQFHVPMNVIQAQIALLRQERYSLLRGMKLPGSVVEQLDAILTQGTCDTFLLLQHSPAIGRTLGEVGLGDGEGTQVVAIVRGGHAVTAFGGGFRLAVGDTLVLAGTHAEMERAFDRLTPPPITGE